MTGVQAAFAHHAASPVYDTSRKITIDGTVSRVRLVNPHALFHLVVRAASGEEIHWIVEAAGKLALTHQGWTNATLRPGDKVRFTGHPARSGAPRLFFSSVVLADGREFLVQREASILAIEEQRRQQRVAP